MHQESRNYQTGDSMKIWHEIPQQEDIWVKDYSE